MAMINQGAYLGSYIVMVDAVCLPGDWPDPKKERKSLCCQELCSQGVFEITASSWLGVLAMKIMEGSKREPAYSWRHTIIMRGERLASYQSRYHNNG